MNWIYEKLFMTVLSWLTGMGSDGFSKIIEWIRRAEETFKNGADRAAWVKEQIMNVLKISTPFVMNLLVEMGVAFAKKKGWIK